MSEAQSFRADWRPETVFIVGDHREEGVQGIRGYDEGVQRTFYHFETDSRYVKRHLKVRVMFYVEGVRGTPGNHLLADFTGG